MKQNEQRKVLIIEDDLALVEMYKEKLKNNGYKASSVMDGKRALYRIKKDNVDIILLDILLPGLNGFEILKRVKSDKATKDIPVIILTNVGSESLDKDRQLAMNLGASDYMIKSLNTPEDVVAKIEKLLKISPALT